jgi:hypothetical protein
MAASFRFSLIAPLPLLADWHKRQPLPKQIERMIPCLSKEGPLQSRLAEDRFVTLTALSQGRS